MLAESWGEFHLPLGLLIKEVWKKGLEYRSQIFCLKYPELRDFPYKKGH